MSAPGFHAVSGPPRDELIAPMDSLARGQCSTDDFVRNMIELRTRHPELQPEVLALLNDYYQRRLIAHQTFISVRSRLQKHLEAVSGQESNDAADAAGEELPVSDLCAGDVFRGRYRLTEIRERNAWGTVVEAVDEHRLDVPDVPKRVVLLVLNQGCARESQLMQRFCRLQSFSHPCIPRVFDVDEHQGRVFASLEWLSGISVRQLLHLNGGHRLALPAALTVLRAVASALAYAHAREIHHGAVDAANVVVSETDEIRLRGFEPGNLEGEGSMAADRLAFAELAWLLLTGESPEKGKLSDDALPGIPQAQRDSLRAILEGREAGQLLAKFAGDGDITSGRFTLGQPLAPESPSWRVSLWRMPGRRVPVWIAAGFAAAAAAVTGYVVSARTGDADIPRAAPAPAPAPAPASAPAPQIVSIAPATAPAAAVQPVVEPAPSVAEPRRRAPAATTAAATRPARIELAVSTLQVSGSDAFARIQVRRSDNVSVPVGFRWWTEGGSAESGRDFVGVEPARVELPAGRRNIELRVPLLEDAARDQAREFYVKIDVADPDKAVLGGRTLTQVTISPLSAAPSPRNPAASRRD